MLRRLCLVLASTFCFVDGGIAATKYVSDTLYIPLKTKSGNGAKVLKHLKSGTAVSILDTSDGEYAKVKVHDDRSSHGWVKKRYLLDEPIAKTRLARLEGTLKKLKSQQGPLKGNVKDLKGRLTVALLENKKLKTQEANLKKQLTNVKNISSKSLELFENNKQLKVETSKLQQDVESLRKENLLLQSNQKNEGIKLGLFAIGLGGLAGFLLPYVKPRGRRNKGIRLR